MAAGDNFILGIVNKANGETYLRTNTEGDTAGLHVVQGAEAPAIRGDGLLGYPGVRGTSDSLGVYGLTRRATGVFGSAMDPTVPGTIGVVGFAETGVAGFGPTAVSGQGTLFGVLGNGEGRGDGRRVRPVGAGLRRGRRRRRACSLAPRICRGRQKPGS